MAPIMRLNPQWTHASDIEMNPTNAAACAPEFGISASRWSIAFTRGWYAMTNPVIRMSTICIENPRNAQNPPYQNSNSSTGPESVASSPAP